MLCWSVLHASVGVRRLRSQLRGAPWLLTAIDELCTRARPLPPHPPHPLLWQGPKPADRLQRGEAPGTEYDFEERINFAVSV